MASNGDTITFLQWNAQGANDKTMEIHQLCRSFDTTFMLLNETFYYSLSGVYNPKYALFRCDRTYDPAVLLNNGARGGSAIMVREGVKVIGERKHAPSGSKRSEWIGVDAIPDERAAVMRVLTGYSPPSSDLDLRWLENEFEEANRLQMPCVFAGDLNAKSPLWSKNKDLWNANGFTLHHAATRLGLTVLPSAPTHVHLSTGTLSTLDVWVLNASALKLLNGGVEIAERYTSDHFATVIKCSVPLVIHQPHRFEPDPDPIPRYDISKANRVEYFKTLRVLLGAINVPQTGEPVARLLTYRRDIVSAIMEARRRHVPVCDKSELKKISMSHEMRYILKRKRVIERAIGNHADPALKEQLKLLDDEFRAAKQRHQLRRDVANLRYVEALSAKHRYHEAWSRLRQLDKHQQPRTVSHMKTDDGRVLAPSQELADELLTHFIAPMTPYADPAADAVTRQRWEEIEREIANDPDLQRSDTIQLPGPQEFSVSQRMLSNAIARLKSFKAPGIDGICNVFYKWGGLPLQTHLRRLFNMSLGSKFVLPEWKEAIAVGVPKPGKPREAIKSQRPISLLPADAKILESIITTWMGDALEEQHALPDNQYAFRQHRSAPDVPLRVAHRVHLCRQQRQKMVLVGLDVQAAYDSVWHFGLIYKLVRLPLPRNLVGWLADYLKDRKLQARVSGYLSRQVTLNCGVPQGSPLSPLLYIIYTADLLSCPSAPGSSTDAYADDLTVVGVGEDFLAAERNVQAEVNRIATWACAWRQKFNASKSECMPFTAAPTAPNLNLMIGGEAIPQVTVMRVLGIHFDVKLTWKAHFDKVINRCSRNLSLFHRITHSPGLSPRWRRTAYLALIRATATYGNVAFSTASKRQLHRLNVLQNKCLRAICNVRPDDRVRIVELERRCHVPSLSSFFAQTQRRYVESAVRHVLPIREDIERIRMLAQRPQRSPMTVLNSRLPDGPLPPPKC